MSESVDFCLSHCYVQTEPIAYLSPLSVATLRGSDSRESAPSDQYENHRDHRTTPLSIICSQWAAGGDPRTSMRITDTV